MALDCIKVVGTSAKFFPQDDKRDRSGERPSSARSNGLITFGDVVSYTAKPCNGLSATNRPWSAIPHANISKRAQEVGYASNCQKISGNQGDHEYSGIYDLALRAEKREHRLRPWSAQPNRSVQKELGQEAISNGSSCTLELHGRSTSGQNHPVLLKVSWDNSQNHERSVSNETGQEQLPLGTKVWYPAGSCLDNGRPRSPQRVSLPMGNGRPSSATTEISCEPLGVSCGDLLDYTEWYKSSSNGGSRPGSGRRPASASRPCSREANGWVKTGDGPWEVGCKTPGAGLDKNTVKWQSWTTSSKPLEEEESHDPSMYKLTKAEFRRLSEQVRDVNHNMKNGRSRGGSNFRRLVGSRQNIEDNAPVLYRSQLAESMKAFDVKPPRRPLIPEPPVPEYTRCRPVIGSRPMSVQAERRPLSAIEGLRQRPKSSVPKITTTESSPTPNDDDQYDTLASPCIYDLTDSDKLDSGYGDVYSINDDEDDSSVSDVDTEASEVDGPEPDVDEERKVPELALRPDVVDFSYATDGRRDYRKYDFDASNVTIESCEFAYGGPDGFQAVDFKDLSKFDKNWRLLTKKRPKAKQEEKIIDRFIELERLVAKTVDWEDRRRERCRLLNRQRLSLSNAMKKEGRLRVQSAKYRGTKCCSECLNQACIGDCPMKKTSSAQFCVHCRQEFCDSRCVQSSYNNHCRHSQNSDSDDENKEKPKPRPRSCVPCQRKNTAKYINANQILLGRPRSSHATYTRGQHTMAPKDSVKLEDPDAVHHDLVKELDKIGLDTETCSRPCTAKGRKKLKGRPSMAPGKSYFSQRRDSIQKERVKSAPARIRRVKSAQRQRPTTAT